MIIVGGIILSTLLILTAIFIFNKFKAMEKIIVNLIDALNEVNLNEKYTHYRTTCNSLIITHLMDGDIEAINKVTKKREEMLDALKSQEKTFSVKELGSYYEKCAKELVEYSGELLEENKYRKLLKLDEEVPKKEYLN